MKKSQTEEPTTETDTIEQETSENESSSEDSTGGSSLLGLIFGSDDDEEKSEDPEVNEEVEQEEETPSTWSKVKGFFEVSASEDVPDQEEPDTSVIASIAPEDSDDLCERAPSLILEMRKKLLEMEALPDPRLRDSRNDELFPTIYFDFDQSLIKPDFKDQLQNQTPCVLEQLEKNEDLIVQVEGHADERGNDEYNNRPTDTDVLILCSDWSRFMSPIPQESKPSVTAKNFLPSRVPTVKPGTKTEELFLRILLKSQ